MLYLFKRAVSVFAGNWLAILGAGIFWYLFVELSMRLFEYPLVWWLLLVLVMPALIVGHLWFYLSLYDGEKTQPLRVFLPFRHYFKIDGTLNFMALLLALWSILLIIPAIIKGLAYSQTPFLLKDHPKMGILEAITASRTIMKGRKGAYFGWQLLYGLGLFGILTVGLLLATHLFGAVPELRNPGQRLGLGISNALFEMVSNLVVLPLYFLVLAGFYRELSRNYEEEILQFAEKTTSKPKKILRGTLAGAAALGLAASAMGFALISQAIEDGIGMPPARERLAAEVPADLPVYTPQTQETAVDPMEVVSIHMPDGHVFYDQWSVNHWLETLAQIDRARGNDRQLGLILQDDQGNPLELSELGRFTPLNVYPPQVLFGTRELVVTLMLEGAEPDDWQQGHRIPAANTIQELLAWADALPFPMHVAMGDQYGEPVFQEDLTRDYPIYSLFGQYVFPADTWIWVEIDRR